MQQRVESFLRAPVSRYASLCILVPIVVWGYWESQNLVLFEWFNIDGYPTLVAAHLWMDGHSAAVYSPSLWIYEGGNLLWKKQMAALGIFGAGTSYVYHPLYLFFCAPFIVGLTADQFAYLLVLLNALSLGVVAAETLRFGNVDFGAQEWFALVSICVCFPAIYAAYCGQNILPTLALLMLGCRCLDAGHLKVSAVLLTLAAAMKIWVVPVVILLFFLHGWAASVVGLSIMAIGLALLPLAVDPELFLAYVDIAGRLAEITVYPYNNVSLRGMLTRIESPEWVDGAFMWLPHVVSKNVRIVETLIQGAIAALALFLWFKNRPSPRLTFVVALSLLLLLPGVCWTHYLLFSLPLGCLLWLRGKALVKWVGAIFLIFLALPWHALPLHQPIWSIRTMILNNPYVMIFVMAIPLSWAVATSVLALIAARDLDLALDAVS